MTPSETPRPARRRRVEPDVLVVISLGGMLGAAARYGVAQRLPVRAGQFPWATFWTNLAGCLLLGLALALIIERFPSSRYLRPLVGSGILGAFTTMSTYQVEATLLLKDGQAAIALVYLATSMAAGLMLGYAGLRAGRLLPVARTIGRR